MSRLTLLGPQFNREHISPIVWYDGFIFCSAVIVISPLPCKTYPASPGPSASNLTFPRLPYHSTPRFTRLIVVISDLACPAVPFPYRAEPLLASPLLPFHTPHDPTQPFRALLNHAGRAVNHRAETRQTLPRLPIQTSSVMSPPRLSPPAKPRLAGHRLSCPHLSCLTCPDII